MASPLATPSSASCRVALPGRLPTPSTRRHGHTSLRCKHGPARTRFQACSAPGVDLDFTWSPRRLRRSMSPPPQSRHGRASPLGLGAGAWTCQCMVAYGRRWHLTSSRNGILATPRFAKKVCLRLPPNADLRPWNGEWAHALVGEIGGAKRQLRLARTGRPLPLSADASSVGLRGGGLANANSSQHKRRFSG